MPKGATRWLLTSTACMQLPTSWTSGRPQKEFEEAVEAWQTLFRKYDFGVGDLPGQTPKTPDEVLKGTSWLAKTYRRYGGRLSESEGETSE